MTYTNLKKGFHCIIQNINITIVKKNIYIKLQRLEFIMHTIINKAICKIKLCINPSAWGHLIPSSYCDVGRFFYRVFKF